MGATDLNTLAQDLLTVCVDALDTIPGWDPNLEGAPDRAFVSPGRPALEGCGQLVVHAESVLFAPLIPGGLYDGKRNTTAVVNHVRLVATIDRCVQDTRSGVDITEPYKTTDLEATAAQVDADVWAIWNGVFWTWSSGDFLSFCSELFFEGARALPEEGGRAGWVLSWRATLQGYDEGSSS